MNQLRKRSQGFTLIELMLAMTFISILLLAIAMTTIQISHIYTKGVTFRSVNQAGRTINADLQQDAAVSMPFDVYTSGTTVPSGCGASPRYVQQCSGGVQSGGRLCMGTISYVWNYGVALNGGGVSIPNMYTGGGPVRFARVNDPGGQLCLNANTPVDQSAATELLGGKDSLDLALHSLTVQTSPAATDQTSGQQMYSISYTIGTNEQYALTTGNSQCVPPNTAGGGKESDWEYCAVNSFTTVVRAGNQLEGGQ